VRPGLDKRTGLSKSALIDFDICQQRAWFSFHHPMPYIPNPNMTFGSCVDRGVEVLIECARAGIPLDYERAYTAAAEAQERDGIEVDQDEVQVAVRAFADDEAQSQPKKGEERQLAPLSREDWSYCRTQAHIHVPFFDLGEIDGHPDIILASNVIKDVKTARRMRDTARTLELILYALMVEEETGKPVPEVGYLVWVRLKTPMWREITTYVTDAMRDWAYQRVAAYVRAQRADEVLNRSAKEPQNWTFPGGAVNGRFCDGCRYNPLYGGPCQMAATGEDDDE
jgi:hypothetical protein